MNTRYDNLFSEIWIASAFKGATRQLEIIPNAKLHYNNHLSWLNVIKNFPSPHKIKGIALTGWSRYIYIRSFPFPLIFNHSENFVYNLNSN